MMRSIIVSISNPCLLRTSREILDRRIIGPIGLQKLYTKLSTNTTFMNHNRCNASQQSSSLLNARHHSNIAYNPCAYALSSVPDTDLMDETCQTDSIQKARGESEFWRRKMRTLHKVLDVNKDGVISFDDFNLLTVRFTKVGNLTPEISAEFFEIMKQTWEEQWGEINPYNLITAEQFLSVLHDKLNDKDQIKKIDRFLPYIFKAVDTHHTGFLDLEQYKLFFRCLGLSDEDAAISFAVIDKNGDSRLSLNEFVYLGRQFFLTENEQNISKMFWGPLTKY